MFFLDTRTQNDLIMGSCISSDLIHFYLETLRGLFVHRKNYMYLQPNYNLNELVLARKVMNQLNTSPVQNFVYKKFKENPKLQYQFQKVNLILSLHMLQTKFKLSFN